MARKKKTKKPEWPMVLETFMRPGLGRAIYMQNEPRAFNGIVNVVRYKVTIEPVDEPDAIAERIRRLWRENNNSHLIGPLRDEAKRHGVDLDRNDHGKDAKPRW